VTQPEAPRRKVTSFDVARRAGVSRAAVSRAFTPDASVSPETREKVHTAAKALGYRVNFLARSLINQRSDLVGIVAAGFDNPYRTMQIEQITRALLARNFRPVLLPVSSAGDTSELIGQLLQYAVSGVVITSDAPPSSLCEECADHGVPIVLINKGDDIPLVDRVVSDDKAAGQLAAAHLTEAGVERPAVMGATAPSYTARRRVEAFLARCRALGYPAEHIALEANSYADGYEAAPRLAALGVDGVFCVNDYLACGVIDRLHHDGAPAVRVIGHDDIPQAAWGAYRLTTLRQPVDLQARQAIDLLTGRMDNPRRAAQVEFTPVTLVPRRSA
jgi:LacI family transcriptional regulator